MFKSTKKHASYWKHRKIDWAESYQSTWNHPHRSLIVWMIKNIPFISLWEVGCGGGANLIKIAKELTGKQLGGSDVNADAIKLCRETFNQGLFHVEEGNNLMMSDKSVDIVLSDMTLIYVDPLNITSYLNEFKRVGRSYLVLCEFHSESWWKRLKARFGGYHVYNYYQRLEALGFYDIMVQHIPEQYWPGADNNSEFRSIITCKIP
jgi:ubiquinone/menaquinone biosynthesis C-methylase UbiE